MKVFLSGKVDEQHGKWRDLLLGEKYTDGKPGPHWELMHKGDTFDDPFAPWPTLRSAVMGTHDYVGPYRQTLGQEQDNSNTGYFHGVESGGSHGQMNFDDQQAVVAACMKGIDACDMLFAYINTANCYGTLCEIGYARARNKFVAVVAAPGVEGIDDMWFAGLLANFYCDPTREDVTEKESLERAFLEAASHFSARKTKPAGTLLERLVFSHGR